MQIPIGMVVTSVDKFSNGKCQLFGFWYYKDFFVSKDIGGRKRRVGETERMKNEKCKM